MKRWLAFVVPFLVVCAIGAALLGWRWMAGRACTSHTTVEFFDLSPEVRCVTVTGTAHYEVVVTQTVAGNGFFDDRKYWVYGLFPKGNSTEREIRVLVRTEREPERLVSYEDLTIHGRVIPMDHNKIPFDTETRMGANSSYFFSDRVVLLEPERVEVDGEPPWTAP